jgi:uncharacterized protein YjbI with pentapeptide repeats
MTDAAAPALDNETPVNPYSLLEAVNRASRSASLAWLLLLAVTAYLGVAVAGIGHRDLLFDADVVLPIVQSKIGLLVFFVVAPTLFVLLHLAVIGQMALLARKTLEFAAAIRLLEVSDKRTHPLRHELDTFFLVQAIAGPERSRVIGALLQGLAWLTLVVLPVLVLLYVQMVFLPYHAVAITTVHRAAVLMDLVLLTLLGVFLLRSETSLLRASLRAARQHALGLLLASATFVAAAGCSLFLATIPGERLDRSDLFGAARAGGIPSVLGQALPRLGLPFRPETAFLSRNLIVSDLDLTAGRALAAGRSSLNLRGRDLRFAIFDRSDLRRVDFSGADLDGASFVDADLRNVSMLCVLERQDQSAGEDRRGGGCTSARKTNLTGARLAEAKLSGIDLREANLEAAQLEAAQLNAALLSGANVSQANLARANLSGGAQLRGAKLVGASLPGADLSGAQLQLANFSGARLQGADLSAAGLEGARLRNAELEGANLARSTLYAADLTGAKLAGADLTAAAVWRTMPPANEHVALADMTQLGLRPPRDAELAQLSASSVSDEASLKVRLVEEVRPGGAAEKAWAGSAEHQAWQGFAKPREGTDAEQFKSRLTGYLTRLICASRFADGAVAGGIARRAMAPGFKGDALAIHERLKSADCPASQNISTRLLLELGAAVELSRAQD